MARKRESPDDKLGEGHEYREFKGTPLQGGQAVSRVLSVQAREEKVFVELTSGPGAVMATGAITPRRGADPAIPSVKVVVVFEWHAIQRRRSWRTC